MAGVPVLYTVGLLATFWNTISSVWAVWAAQSSKEKLGYLRATFEGVFFNFLLARFFLNSIASVLIGVFF